MVDKIKLNRDQIRFALGKFSKLGGAPTVAEIDRRLSKAKKMAQKTGSLSASQAKQLLGLGVSIDLNAINLQKGRLQLLRNRLKVEQPPSKRD